MPLIPAYHIHKVKKDVGSPIQNPTKSDAVISLSVVSSICRGHEPLLVLGFFELPSVPVFKQPLGEINLFHGPAS